MPSLLSRTRPNSKQVVPDAIAPDATATDVPNASLSAMHDCVRAARGLERSSCEIDRAVSARDAALSQFAGEHKTKLAAIETENKKRVENTRAIKANADQSIKTERAQVKTMIDSVAPSGGFLSYGMPEIGNVPLPSDSGPEIARMIRDVAQVVNERSLKLQPYRTPFAQGQHLGARVLVGLAFVFFASFYQFGNAIVSTALCLAVVGGLIALYLSNKNALQTARTELASLAKSLKKRNIWESEQAQQKAEATFQAQSEENAGQHKAALDGRIGENNRAVAKAKADFEARRDALAGDIKARYDALQSDIARLDSGLACGGWKDEAWHNWEPTVAAPGCLRIGTLQPQTPRFRALFAHWDEIQIPALVDYEAGKGLVIYVDSALEGTLEGARKMAQSAITRLLGTVPAAGVKFVFLDPVSLGGNVAGFMKLEKYEPTLIGGKAWSDARHIETALAEVTDHMETVIQKYLREDYKSIAQYNAKARVKEAYRIIVAFDFPVNFSEAAAKRLNSIMRNGPRCGVFPIVIVDRSKPMPYGINLEDLQAHALVMEANHRG